MPEPSARREIAARARLAASWLALGAGIDIASLAFTVVAVAALLWLDFSSTVRLAVLSAVLSGLAEKFFALRVAFDQAIFSDWARRWKTGDATAPSTDMANFDAALAATGLRPVREASRRTAEERIRGAMKLLTYQAGLFIIQALAILTAAICRHGS